MDIKGLGPLSAYEQFKIKQEEESLRPEKNVKESSAEKKGDEVAVSGEARLRGTIHSEASKSTGIDEDKVARLKAMVESGEYQPDAKSIASNMIRDELEEWDF
jgi:flagellar biosynthesis anti-sigma factor FlgM